MGEATRQSLTREKRIRKYAKFFSGVQEKLTQFGLSMDNSALICDLILSLSTAASNRKKYRGVYKRRNQRGYYSKITKDGCYFFIGNFSTPEEAAFAYDKKCWQLYKNSQKLNFPNHYTLV